MKNITLTLIITLFAFNNLTYGNPGEEGKGDYCSEILNQLESGKLTDHQRIYLNSILFYYCNDIKEARKAKERILELISDHQYDYDFFFKEEGDLEFRSPIGPRKKEKFNFHVQTELIPATTSYFPYAYKKERYRDTAYVHIVAFRKDKEILPLFLGKRETRHYPHEDLVFERRHDHDMDYIAENLGIELDDIKSFTTITESVFNKDKKPGAYGLYGKTHITSSVHCHEPFSGRIIPHCGNDPALKSSDKSENKAADSDEKGIKKTKQLKRRFAKETHLPFPKGKLIITFNPKVKPTPDSRYTKANVIGVTYLKPTTVNSETYLFPAKPTFYAINPDDK